MSQKFKLISSILVSACLVGIAQAEPAKTAENLGKEYTPLGGEAAANADGSIPAYAGAESPIAGWAWGKNRASFWKHKDEKPLFSITKSNYEKYASNLTAGQIEMFKEVPGYRMDVYPTHRTCSSPDFVQENTKKNVGFAKVGPEGWILTEAMVPGIPFPYPKTGAEVMLNGKMRYHGEGMEFQNLITAVSPRKGGSEWIKAYQDLVWYMPWAKKGSTKLSSLPPIEWYMNFAYTSPPALAGQALDITMRLNAPGSELFYYFPGQRRVRRMPTYAYDSPQIGFENQYTMDEASMFFGTIDRFDWKLIGKKEIYTAYNSFEPWNFEAQWADFAGDDLLKRDKLRYEKHRVWVVEGTVKEGSRHTSPKKTYYVDEDSWAYLDAEDHDGQGKITKVREGYPIPIYELGGACDATAFSQYNIPESRYVFDVHGFASGRDIKWLMEAKGPKYNPNYYTADSLRAQSER